MKGTPFAGFANHAALNRRTQRKRRRKKKHGFSLFSLFPPVHRDSIRLRIADIVLAASIPWKQHDMTETMPTFSLLTKVLAPHHCTILHDWLAFLTTPPLEMLIYAPNDAAIAREIERLAQEFRVPWQVIPMRPEDDLKHNETQIMNRMVQEANGAYLLLVHLDTLPFRGDGQETAWLQEVFARLASDDRLRFFSGCGVRFLEDELEPSGKYRRTQRFSNNFGLISKEFWMAAMAAHPVAAMTNDVGQRYHSEWAIEEELRQKNLFGLRPVDGMDWRVFHVHHWDGRLLKTRELFRRGVKIKRYLNRIHDQQMHPWIYYYNYPKPPWLRRVRIWAGKLRRDIINVALRRNAFV
jgi:hypothetical protein